MFFLSVYYFYYTVIVFDVPTKIELNSRCLFDNDKRVNYYFQLLFATCTNEYESESK